MGNQNVNANMQTGCQRPICQSVCSNMLELHNSPITHAACSRRRIPAASHIASQSESNISWGPSNKWMMTALLDLRFFLTTLSRKKKTVNPAPPLTNVALTCHVFSCAQLRLCQCPCWADHRGLPDYHSFSGAPYRKQFQNGKMM